MQESEEAILVFDNYSDNQEFSLKLQERINRAANGTEKEYMGKSTQEMPQGKAYQQYLGNTGNKAELIDRFTRYLQQDHVRSNMEGNVISDSSDVSYIINSSELKTLFKYNHEEVDTKTVYCCGSFNKLCIQKAKEQVCLNEYHQVLRFLI